MLFLSSSYCFEGQLISKPFCCERLNCLLSSFCPVPSQGKVGKPLSPPLLSLHFLSRVFPWPIVNLQLIVPAPHYTSSPSYETQGGIRTILHPEFSNGFPPNASLHQTSNILSGKPASTRLTRPSSADCKLLTLNPVCFDLSGSSLLCRVLFLK